jgi:hypothetical protein
LTLSIAAAGRVEDGEKLSCLAYAELPRESQIGYCEYDKDEVVQRFTCLTLWNKFVFLSVDILK